MKRLLMCLAAIAGLSLGAAPGEPGAKFIGAGAANGAKPAIVATDVVNEKDVVKAEWRVTGLGVFSAYVNGRSVGDSALMPGYTHAKKRRLESTLDVTKMWNGAAGATNELSVIVTSGWWCDGIMGKRGGTWPAFRGVLALTHADGTTREIVTDESWRTSTETPVVSAGIWEGEVYDARIEPETWRPAKVSDEFKGEVSPWVGPPVVLRYDKRMEGGDFALKPGETNVIDFGQNCAAVPVLRVRGAAGTKVAVRLGEILNDGVKGHHGDGPEGSVYLANMRGAKAGFDYICNGVGAWAFMPLETFFGYRYAAISADGEVEGYIASLPITSISREMEHGTVVTGREDVNRLVKNAYWGMLSNYLSIPTDCPQRTERLGWTGDTQVFAKTGAYFADIRSFMRKWMQDVRDCQQDSGMVGVVAPLAAFGDNGPNAGWSDAIVSVPYKIWKYLGDEEIVRENWAAMAKYVAFLLKSNYTSKRGDWLTCDWLSFEKLTVDNTLRWSKGTLTEDHLEYQNFLNACHLYEDLIMMREMLENVPGLGAPENLPLLERAESDARARILERWFTKDGELVPLFDGMQTPCLYALGLALGDRARLAAKLVAAIHANGDRLATGFLGTPRLCEVLSEIGEDALAYTLLLQHAFPSWLYSVDQGATTIWERWNGYTKDKGFGPVSMNSFNHYSYGAVVGWLFEYAGGLKPDAKKGGWRHFTIAPKPDKRLGSCRVAFDGGYGQIVSDWRYEGDRLVWRFTIPAGTSATVRDPVTGEIREVQGPANFVSPY